MQIQPYLFFDGRAEEAIEFYQKALGAKVEMMMRFKENPDPPQDGCAGPPKDAGEKIMHAAFKVGDALVMASDGMCLGKPAFQGFSLTLTVPDVAEADRKFAALAKDVTEIVAEVGLSNVTPQPLTVAYHSACSMQHGQKLDALPRKLLREAGFVVKDVPEGHLCCGWAGTYQVLQPDLSRRLRDRKVANIESVKPDVIAAGNFGCIGNIAAGTGIPMAHTVELLDWATGGPRPAALS